MIYEDTSSLKDPEVKELVPDPYLSIYETELKYHVSLFLEYLFVKTGFAKDDVLGFTVVLEPVDKDECYHLPEEIRPSLPYCSHVCGWFDDDSMRLVLYLGCFGRKKSSNVIDISDRADYTLFHLIVHLLQRQSRGLTWCTYSSVMAPNDTDLEKHVVFSQEVEADYLARIFTFLSNEENILSFDTIMSRSSLWPPLKRALFELRSICDKKPEEQREYSSSHLNISAICYNPFRYVSSRVGRVLSGLREVSEALSPGNIIRASLVNPLGFRTKKPITGLYVGRGNICFSIVEDKAHVCYSQSGLSATRVSGFKLEFDNPVEIDLDLLKEIVIEFYAPRAKILFKYAEEHTEISAKLRYTRDIPRPAESIRSIEEYRELIDSFDTKIGIPSGVCNAENSTFIIPLPRYDLQPGRCARDTYYLSSLVLPVDVELCVNLENLPRG